MSQREQISGDSQAPHTAVDTNATFLGWIRSSGKRISLFAALATIAQGTLVSLFNAAAWTGKAANGLLEWIHTVQLVLLIGALLWTLWVVDKRISKNKVDGSADNRTIIFSWLWITILVLWCLFYFIKSLSEWSVPLPSELRNGWLPNALNRAPLIPFFLIYLVLAGRWIPTRAGMWAIALGFVLVVQTFADLSFHHSGKKEHIAWLQLAFGTFECLVISMVVGRFDSKLFPLPSIVMPLLYMYGPVQILFAVAPSATLVHTLYFIALLLKSLLILFVIWIIENNALLPFLESIDDLRRDGPSILTKSRHQPSQYRRRALNGD